MQSISRVRDKWIADYLTLRTQQVVIEGETSKLVDVLSGVPQGSVLGPLLFLIYIDGVGTISLSPESERVIFADDLLLYRHISTPREFLFVQDDITNIEDWSTANYLTLNPCKCKYMIVSRKRAPLLPEFTLMLSGQVLDQVDMYKYLGILLNKDLSWSPHIDAICTKVRKIHGVLYRRFYQFCDSDVLRQLYISLVRPHLEYACHVWAPHTSKDINELENVQKFACKMASRQWNGVQYEQLLSITNLPSLERRRIEQRLCHLFKIVHNLVYFPSNVIVHREEPLYNFHSFHNSCLYQPYARTNSFYDSFVPHTISPWNKLPEDIVLSSTLCRFKQSLRSHSYN